VNLDGRLRPIDDDHDPIAPHRVAPSPVPGKVIDMPRRVDELEPLGDPEQHRSAVVGTVADLDLDPAFDASCRRKVALVIMARSRITGQGIEV